MKAFISDGKFLKKSILLGLAVLVLILFMPHKISASILEDSATIRGLSTGFAEDLATVKSSLKKNAAIIQKRISAVSLVSGSFSPELNLNLDSRVSKNQKAYSFVVEETKSGINTLSSQINLVQLEEKPLQPKPYLESFSSKIKETGVNLVTSFLSLRAKRSNLQQGNPKNQETAFLHESILKNIKETVKDTLPFVTSFLNEEKQEKPGVIANPSTPVIASPSPSVIASPSPSVIASGAKQSQEAKQSLSLSLNPNLPSSPPFLI